MSDSRQPYEKPLLTQLQYFADQSVSLAGACKTSGAASGPTPTGCQSVNPGGQIQPCRQFGS